jgi:hypothetical protein
MKLLGPAFLHINLAHSPSHPLATPLPIDGLGNQHRITQFFVMKVA